MTMTIRLLGGKWAVVITAGPAGLAFVRRTRIALTWCQHRNKKEGRYT